MTSQNIWLITGTSTGLGRELALSALARGDKVIATARSTESVKDLQSLYPDTCRILQLDVTDTFARISAKANEAVDIWGRIDVVVNNAGHALVATVEEAGVEMLLEMYKTNVFGVVNVTNAFLPYLRQRRSGTVVIVGSRSGWRTRFATNALYGSSKAAIHAIADALAMELRPQGIRVLTVVPGGMRTSGINNIRFVGKTPLLFRDPSPSKDLQEHPLGQSDTLLESSKEELAQHSNSALTSHASNGLIVTEVPEYALIRAGVQKYFEATNGAESGDARKAARVIVDVVRGEGVVAGKEREWPMNDTLYLGSDAKRDVEKKCREVLADLEEWGDIARNVDFEEEGEKRL
ncbi:NAD(P)-binding protein [Ramaria rubella]|nr:NAD(P)-binding protein [Ramaria rubella]